jgi:hypothetical protein
MKSRIVPAMRLNAQPQCGHLLVFVGIIAPHCGHRFMGAVDLYAIVASSRPARRLTQRRLQVDG